MGSGQNKENASSNFDILTETKDILVRMSNRMETFEKKLHQIEEKMDQAANDHDSMTTPSRKRSKISVPLEVRVRLLFYVM